MQNAQANSNAEASITLGISIIVPLLNESSVVPSLILHLGDVLDQSGDVELEIILVDGRSTDGTYAALEQQDYNLIQAEPGRARQMNAGAAIAKHSNLLFLHADTRLPQGFLSEVQAAEVWGRFDVSFDTESTFMRVIATFMNARSRLTGVATGDQALFVNKDVFAEIGGFPLIPLMEDVAICKTLRQLHAPYCSKAKVLTSARRWQKNGVLKTVIKMWLFRLAYFFGVPPKLLARAYFDAR